MGKGCVTRPIVNQYVSAVLDCQSALNINGRLQNRLEGGKQSEICCCFRPKDIFCDKIVQANVGGPPSKDYERKLTLIAENMRQLIDRQMTGHIKCTHTHTETDRHSRIVVKQLRRQTVPTSSGELRAWHLI